MTNALRRVQSLARPRDQIELRIRRDLTARAETPLFGSPCLIAPGLIQTLKLECDCAAAIGREMGANRP
jgi:hypothetical protein